MSKGAMLTAIATEHGMKRKDCSNVLDSLVALGTKEVKSHGVFQIPGRVRIKTRHKKATKACVREIFGEKRKVKARPARTVVKAFAAAALKH